PFAQHELTETVKAGDCFQYSLDMKLQGEMRFIKEEAKTVKVNLTATATHALAERVLVAEDGQVKKTARAYETAKASIERGSDKSENVLRAARKLIVAQHHKGEHLVYSPAGALTRSELAVASQQFDTLARPGLPPGRS